VIINLYAKDLINYLLLPLSAIFYLLALSRKAFYRIGLLPTHPSSVPVIVVGNITVGGSGKTPIVIALSKHFKQQNKTVGIVSRGYGGNYRGKTSIILDEKVCVEVVGDEPILIYQQTGAVVAVNKNRAQAVKDLMTQHNVDVVISDDGLQHYGMGRRVEIVVVDGVRRFGNGFFLPAGPLRESTKRLDSVDFVINNGAQHTGEFSSILTPKMLVNLSTGATQPLDFFKHQTCHAVAGIGHPQRFFDTLSALGISVEAHAFADHYAFDKKDLDFIEDYPIIMTAKDCVKCRQFATDKMWYLRVEAVLSDDFLTQLNDKL